MRSQVKHRKKNDIPIFGFESALSSFSLYLSHNFTYDLFTILLLKKLTRIEQKQCKRGTLIESASKDGF